MIQILTIFFPSVTMLRTGMILRTTLERTAMLSLLSLPTTLTLCSWLVTSRWPVRLLLLNRTIPTSSLSTTAHLLVVRQLLVSAEACLVVAVVVVLHVVVLSDVDRVPRPKVAMLRWVRTSRPTDRHRIIATMRTTTLPTLPIVVKRRLTKSTTTCGRIANACVPTKCVTAMHSVRRLSARLQCSLPLRAKLDNRSIQMFAYVAILLNVALLTRRKRQCCAVASSRYSTSFTYRLMTWVHQKLFLTPFSPLTTTSLLRSPPTFSTLPWTSSIPRSPTNRSFPFSKLLVASSLAPFTCSPTTVPSTLNILSSRMSSVLKSSLMNNMTPFSSLVNRFTTLSAKSLTLVLHRMLNKIVPCLSCIFLSKFRFP